MYDYLDDRQTKRLKELVPYEVLAPDADEIIEELDRLNKEYERIYNENCKLREEHNITDIKLLDENERLNNIIEELSKDVDMWNKKYNEQFDIINELEKYIHNELVLDFYNDDMPCELIINKMEKMIKELEGNK